MYASSYERPASSSLSIERRGFVGLEKSWINPASTSTVALSKNGSVSDARTVLIWSESGGIVENFSIHSSV